jgi:hypothetical protein
MIAAKVARASRSPYVVGTGLGLLNIWAFATAKRGLGVTTAFESAAATRTPATASRCPSPTAATVVPGQ